MSACILFLAKSQTTLIVRRPLLASREQKITAELLFLSISFFVDLYIT
jgi:hypothetical protein